MRENPDVQLSRRVNRIFIKDKFEPEAIQGTFDEDELIATRFFDYERDGIILTNQELVFKERCEMIMIMFAVNASRWLTKFIAA